MDRIHGLTYEEIASKGGGILNSAARLAETPEEQLFEDAAGRIREMIAFGTGAIEIKSGYGLSFDAELKMLRVIKKLKSSFQLPIKATFLGAHALPLAYKQNRTAYIQLLTDEMLPAIAEQGLADYCDVFCDRAILPKPKPFWKQDGNLGYSQKSMPMNSTSQEEFRLGLNIGLCLLIT